MNRNITIKLLSAQEVYDTLCRSGNLYDEKNDRYYTIYDILHALDVNENEIDYVQKFSLEELEVTNE